MSNCDEATAEPDKQAGSLKLKTARTLKWNTVDRLASQVLYGVVGVVLANVLSQEDFGLVGALLVFQAFAIIFADSGFGAALLGRCLLLYIKMLIFQGKVRESAKVWRLLT